MCYPVPANNRAHLSSTSSARSAFSAVSLSLGVLTTALESAVDSISMMAKLGSERWSNLPEFAQPLSTESRFELF